MESRAGSATVTLPPTERPGDVFRFGDMGRTTYMTSRLLSNSQSFPRGGLPGGEGDSKALSPTSSQGSMGYSIPNQRRGPSFSEQMHNDRVDGYFQTIRELRGSSGLANAEASTDQKDDVKTTGRELSGVSHSGSGRRDAPSSHLSLDKSDLVSNKYLEGAARKTFACVGNSSDSNVAARRYSKGTDGKAALVTSPNEGSLVSSSQRYASKSALSVSRHLGDAAADFGKGNSSTRGVGAGENVPLSRSTKTAGLFSPLSVSRGSTRGVEELRNLLAGKLGNDPSRLPTTSPRGGVAGQDERGGLEDFTTAVSDDRSYSLHSHDGGFRSQLPPSTAFSHRARDVRPLAVPSCEKAEKLYADSGAVVLDASKRSELEGNYTRTESTSVHTGLPVRDAATDYGHGNMRTPEASLMDGDRMVAGSHLSATKLDVEDISTLRDDQGIDDHELRAARQRAANAEASANRHLQECEADNEDGERMRRKTHSRRSHRKEKSLSYQNRGLRKDSNFVRDSHSDWNSLRKSPSGSPQQQFLNSSSDTSIYVTSGGGRGPLRGTFPSASGVQLAPPLPPSADWVGGSVADGGYAPSRRSTSIFGKKEESGLQLSSPSERSDKGLGDKLSETHGSSKTKGGHVAPGFMGLGDTHVELTCTPGSTDNRTGPHSGDNIANHPSHTPHRSNDVSDTLAGHSPSHSDAISTRPMFSTSASNHTTLSPPLMSAVDPTSLRAGAGSSSVPFLRKSPQRSLEPGISSGGPVLPGPSSTAPPASSFFASVPGGGSTQLGWVPGAREKGGESLPGSRHNFASTLYSPTDPRHTDASSRVKEALSDHLTGYGPAAPQSILSSFEGHRGGGGSADLPNDDSVLASSRIRSTSVGGTQAAGPRHSNDSAGSSRIRSSSSSAVSQLPARAGLTRGDAAFSRAYELQEKSATTHDVLLPSENGAVSREAEEERGNTSATERMRDLSQIKFMTASNSLESLGGVSTRAPPSSFSTRMHLQDDRSSSATAPGGTGEGSSQTSRTNTSAHLPGLGASASLKGGPLGTTPPSTASGRSESVAGRFSSVCVCQASRYMARQKAHYEQQLRRVEDERQQQNQRRRLLAQQEAQFQQLQAQLQRQRDSVIDEEKQVRDMRTQLNEERSEMEKRWQQLEAQHEELADKKEKWRKTSQQKREELQALSNKLALDKKQLEEQKKEISVMQSAAKERAESVERAQEALKRQREELDGLRYSAERAKAQADARAEMNEQEKRALKEREEELARLKEELRRQERSVQQKELLLKRREQDFVLKVEEDKKREVEKESLWRKQNEDLDRRVRLLGEKEKEIETREDEWRQQQLEWQREKEAEKKTLRKEKDELEEEQRNLEREKHRLAEEQAENRRRLEEEKKRILNDLNEERASFEASRRRCEEELDEERKLLAREKMDLELRSEKEKLQREDERRRLAEENRRVEDEQRRREEALGEERDALARDTERFQAHERETREQLERIANELKADREAFAREMAEERERFVQTAKSEEEQMRADLKREKEQLAEDVKKKLEEFQREKRAWEEEREREVNKLHAEMEKAQAKQAAAEASRQTYEEERSAVQEHCAAEARNLQKERMAFEEERKRYIEQVERQRLQWEEEKEDFLRDLQRQKAAAERELREQKQAGEEIIEDERQRLMQMEENQNQLFEEQMKQLRNLEADLDMQKMRRQEEISKQISRDEALFEREKKLREDEQRLQREKWQLQQEQQTLESQKRQLRQREDQHALRETKLDEREQELTQKADDMREKLREVAELKEKTERLREAESDLEIERSALQAEKQSFEMEKKAIDAQVSAWRRKLSQKGEEIARKEKEASARLRDIQTQEKVHQVRMHEEGSRLKQAPISLKNSAAVTSSAGSLVSGAHTRRAAAGGGSEGDEQRPGKRATSRTRSTSVDRRKRALDQSVGNRSSKVGEDKLSAGGTPSEEQRAEQQLSLRGGGGLGGPNRGGGSVASLASRRRGRSASRGGEKGSLGSSRDIVIEDDKETDTASSFNIRNHEDGNSAADGQDSVRDPRASPPTEGHAWPSSPSAKATDYVFFSRDQKENASGEPANVSGRRMMERRGEQLPTREEEGKIIIKESGRVSQHSTAGLSSTDPTASTTAIPLLRGCSTPPLSQERSTPPSSKFSSFTPTGHKDAPCSPGDAAPQQRSSRGSIRRVDADTSAEHPSDDVQSHLHRTPFLDGEDCPSSPLLSIERRAKLFSLERSCDREKLASVEGRENLSAVSLPEGEGGPPSSGGLFDNAFQTRARPQDDAGARVSHVTGDRQSSTSGSLARLALPGFQDSSLRCASSSSSALSYGKAGDSPTATEGENIDGPTHSSRDRVPSSSIAGTFEDRSLTKNRVGAEGVRDESSCDRQQHESSAKDAASLRVSPSSSSGLSHSPVSFSGISFGISGKSCFTEHTPKDSQETRRWGRVLSGGSGQNAEVGGSRRRSARNVAEGDHPGAEKTDRAPHDNSVSAVSSSSSFDVETRGSSSSFHTGQYHVVDMVVGRSSQIVMTREQVTEELSIRHREREESAGGRQSEPRPSWSAGSPNNSQPSSVGGTKRTRSSMNGTCKEDLPSGNLGVFSSASQNVFSDHQRLSTGNSDSAGPPNQSYVTRDSRHSPAVEERGSFSEKIRGSERGMSSYSRLPKLTPIAEEGSSARQPSTMRNFTLGSRDVASSRNCSPRDRETLKLRLAAACAPTGCNDTANSLNGGMTRFSCGEEDLRERGDCNIDQHGTTSKRNSSSSGNMGQTGEGERDVSRQLSPLRTTGDVSRPDNGGGSFVARDSLISHMSAFSNNGDSDSGEAAMLGSREEAFSSGGRSLGGVSQPTSPDTRFSAAQPGRKIAGVRGR